jgi:hypothetical protein
MSPNNVEHSEPTSEKLKDFHRDPSYERRVAIFYDVLGWRSRITEAGNRVDELGKLRRLILRHTRSLPLRPIHGIRFSTFSNNIVIYAEGE